MTVQEASHLWFFESHNSSRRSQWLQSTLSELEEKTQGMLKLIESDADTFAQRAEMYYKKRPELVNMIEDFYRSYRSLAERYDQLKLESGNSFSNRGYFNKEWSFIDKLSASSVIFDSESEVDDPSEVDQIDSVLRKVPRKKDGNDLANLKHVGAEIFQVGMKRERSDFSTYSIDSELSEVSFPGQEESPVESKLEESPQEKRDICVVKVPRKKDGNDLANLEHVGADIFQVGMKRESFDFSTYSIDSELSEISFPGQEESPVESKLEESPQEKRDICVVKHMNEKVESIEVKTRYAADKCFEHSETLHGELKEGQDENNFPEFSEKEEVINLSNSNLLIEDMAGKSSMSSFEASKILHPGREETEGENNLKEVTEEKHVRNKADLMSEVERLTWENVMFKAELERKDEEKREVIRQLSLSIDILRGEKDSMKKFIRGSKNRVSLFEFRKWKGVLSRKLFWNQSKFSTTLVAL